MVPGFCHVIGFLVNQSSEDEWKEIEQLLEPLFTPEAREAEFGNAVISIDSPDSQVRVGAIGSCAALIYDAQQSDVFPDGVLGILEQGIEDPSSHVREAVIGAVAWQYSPEFERFVLPVESLLDDELIGAEPRRYAINWLAGWQNERAIRELLDLLAALSLEDRIFAAERLAELLPGCVPVTESLRQSLFDNVDTVRIHAALTLWNSTQNAESLVPVLRQILESNNTRDVFNAARAMIRIGLPAIDALPDLLSLRDSEDWNVQLQAVRALPHFDCPDHQARLILESFKDHPNGSVQAFVSTEWKRRGFEQEKE